MICIGDIIKLIKKEINIIFLAPSHALQVAVIQYLSLCKLKEGNYKNSNSYTTNLTTLIKLSTVCTYIIS